MLDKTRTPILKAILALDRTEILNQEIQPSSFEYLASHPKKPGMGNGHFSKANGITLRQAALFLGNFDAFRALNCREVTNDGSLHLAAVLALPKFVEWLLKKHDADHEAETYEKMIPLALACASTQVVWCKIANTESGLNARRKETMKLLAPKTDLKWRNGKKSVLHFALDQGPEVTKAMVEALNIRYDPERDEKYLLIDREGIHYSPEQYVKKLLLGVTETEKSALVRCLTDAGMVSRYYKNIRPSSKEKQPVGYHGLPPTLAALWSAHEISLRPAPVYRADSLGSLD
jgi:hypothetical protein